MEKAKQSTTSYRILMFPWLAHGHISPFLELSKRLSIKNFQIYFCSTKINLSFIKKSLAADENSSDHLIEFVELHLPDVPELPPHYHTTKNLPPHLMSTLMRAFQDAKSSFSKIIETLNPDLVIYDSFQSWASTLAAISNISSVHFATSGAASMSFFCHQLTSSTRRERNGESFPFSEIFQRDYEREKLQALIESNKEVAEDFAFRSFELSSEIVLIKSCREVEEKKYLDYLSFLCGKKMVTTGPLIQECEDNDDHVDIIKFLNKKDPSSVVFVCFGSEYFLSKEEMEETACGLEHSEVNFIWVVRFPVGSKISTIQEALPGGFLERVKERGMVVDGWAPQAKILEHSSIGGFVSHCGWSSVMESLYYGVPLIGMPMHLDQPTNARLLVEVGVGMEVLRGENGQLRREEIARVIKNVVLEKNGEELRGKARELSEKMRLKGEIELDEALEELRNLCSKKNKKQLSPRPS